MASAACVRTLADMAECFVQIQDLKRRCSENNQSVRPLEEQVQQLQNEHDRLLQCQNSASMCPHLNISMPLQIQDLKRRCSEKDQSVRPLEEQVQQLQDERQRIQLELEEANRDR